jgi:hypothetical protein
MYLKTKENRIQARYIPKGFTVYQEHEDGIVYSGIVETPKFGSVYGGIAYRGTSSKCEWYYQFKTLESLAEKTRLFFEKVDAIKQENISKRQSKKEFKTSLKPNDILYTSWGYDQTNVEFYQVLTVHNNTITIQEICQEYTPTQSMAGYTLPVPNKPVKVNNWIDGVCQKADAPIVTKRAQGYTDLNGVTKDHVKINESATAWKWDGQKKYTSSYA